MIHPERPSGPQFHADRPAEQEAVRTTIVGGRPPGSGQPVGSIPRGIEVLVKKAAVDPEFKALLLTERGEAARQIGLELDPAEAMMLAAAPEVQLRAIIAHTSVPHEHRRAFLGQAAAAMLAAIGAITAGCDPTLGSRPDGSKGIRPERPERIEPTKGERPDPPPPIQGIRPEKPPEKPERIEPTDGIRPDRPPIEKGIRPDLPPEKPVP